MYTKRNRIIGWSLLVVCLLINIATVIYWLKYWGIGYNCLVAEENDLNRWFFYNNISDLSLLVIFFALITTTAISFRNRRLILLTLLSFIIQMIVTGQLHMRLAH